MRIRDLQPGQSFRLDHNGYAGNSYLLRQDGRVRECGDFGRVWTLADCGLSPDTEIHGPVWGAPANYSDKP